MPKLDLSQGSAATYRRYGEKYYTSCWKFNWLSSRERIVKFFQMWQSYRHEFGVLLFCDTVYITYHDVSTWTWGWTRKSPINVLLTIWRETSSQGSLRIHCVQKAVPFCWRKTRRNIAIFFEKKTADFCPATVCITRPMLSCSDCPSVCPSVCRVHVIYRKTFSPSGRSIILVLLTLRYSGRFPLKTSVGCRSRYEKQSRFSTSRSLYLENDTI